MARLRPAGDVRVRRVAAERGFAGRLLSWRHEARISQCAYFIVAGRFEVVSWAEPRDSRRFEVGSFRDASSAQRACELDAARRLAERETG